MKKLLSFSLILLLTLSFSAGKLVGQDTLIIQTNLNGDTSISVKPATPAAPASQPPPPAATKQNKVRKDTRPWSQRINFDVNTSFWANKNQVFSEFMVLVSYRFPKIWSIGAGPSYILNYDRVNDVNLNGWGGKIFARAQFLRFLYAWTEYQGIDNQYVAGINPVVRKSEYVNSWFFGAGINVRMGRRSGFNLSVLYDILHTSSSPYSEAVTYRVGFGF